MARQDLPHRMECPPAADLVPAYPPKLSPVAGKKVQASSRIALARMMAATIDLFREGGNPWRTTGTRH